MKNFLKAAAVAGVLFVPLVAAQAQQQQGSNQAGDAATNWNAARQGYGASSDRREYSEPSTYARPQRRDRQ